MKKLFFLAAVLALACASCGNKSQNNASAAGQEATADTVQTEASLSPEAEATADNLTAELRKAVEAKDQKAAISSLANLQTVYKNLVEQGKLDEAKAYGSAIKKFVSDNADEIKSLASGNTTVESLVDGIVNLPTSVAATAEQAKAAIKSDVVDLASPAIAKGQTVVSDAKAAAEMVKNAPAAVKTAAESTAKQAVDDAKAAAKAKAKEGVDNLEKKGSEAVEKGKQKLADKAQEGKQKANDALNKLLK